MSATSGHPVPAKSTSCRARAQGLRLRCSRCVRLSRKEPIDGLCGITNARFVRVAAPMHGTPQTPFSGQCRVTHMV